MLAVNESHLENGLRVVTVEQPHLHSACVSLFVNCGSRHEANVEWGLSHLLEHMLFRSSERFPDKVARALERYGGSLQAATWRDHTQLWTPIHPSRLREALALLGEMVSQPRFQNLEVERNIVEAELQQDLDEQGRDTDINNISRASIWHGHPMGRRIAGSFETLRSFDVDDVHAHHAKHYVAGNSVLCVAGKVRHQEVEELARRAFTGMRAGERTHNGAAACFVPGSPLYLVHRDGPQLDIQLTFEALPDQHRDFAALSLLTRVLDDGSSSRLQNAICERRGLVYELTTGLDCYADCGLYDIEMRVSPRRAASAVAATLETIAQLCTTGISDDELELAREQQQQASQEHARLQEQAAQERARLQEQAVQDRARLEEQAVQDRARLEEQAVQDRARLEEQAAQERARLEEQVVQGRARLEEQVAEQARLQEQLNEVRQRYEESERLLAAERANLTAERERLQHELGTVRAGLQEELQLAQSQKDELSAELQASVREQRQLEQRLGELNASMEEGRARHAEQERRADDLQGQLDATEKTLQAAEARLVAEGEAKLQAAQASSAARFSELEERAAQQATALGDKVQDLEERLHVREQELLVLREQQQLTADAERQQLSALTQQLAQSEQMRQELDTQLGRARKDSQSLEAQIKDLLDETVILRQTIDGLQANLHEVSAQRDELLGAVSPAAEAAPAAQMAVPESPYPPDEHTQITPMPNLGGDTAEFVVERSGSDSKDTLFGELAVRPAAPSSSQSSSGLDDLEDLLATSIPTPPARR